MAAMTAALPAAFTAPRRAAAKARVAARSATRMQATHFDSMKFMPIKESQVAREMSSRYFKDLDKAAESDVVIVGAGSAGLSCAYELTKYPEVSVTIIEQSVSPGGGVLRSG